MCPADFSVIVTCDGEQQPRLRQMLPELLSLRCNGEREVIVVDKQHDKDLGEWLADMEAEYPHLSHTFCSPTARGIDTHRLALTLGARSAIYEWLALLPVEVRLQGEDLLGRLASYCTDGTDVVAGITDRRFRWKCLVSRIFRRRFPLFRPTSSVILCRRECLLQGRDIKLSNCQIVKL